MCIRDSSEWVGSYWFLIPVIPFGIWLFIKLVRRFKEGRMGWDLFMLNVPIFGMLIEKNTLARGTRTLGTLIQSGVPILEGLNITKETCGHALFERLFTKVSEAIREGETIAKPIEENAFSIFHPVALVLWILVFAGPMVPLLFMKEVQTVALPVVGAAAMCGGLFYFMKMKRRVVEHLVVNMIDVGEETGELDVMLYKVANYYEEEVRNITDGMMKLIEPVMIIFLGLVVLFIVAALFMPLIAIIGGLTG